MGKARGSRKRKPYVKDLVEDEIRWGFMVTTWRKKLWDKQIELLLEADRICRANGIPYFALNGTMLGAARHHGFVPWDDDLDIGMFRPDYERFKQVAMQEVRPPFFLQSAYSGDRQGGILFILKLRDDRTTFLGVRELDKSGHQGIFIDIFPIDSYDETTDEGRWVYAAGNEILTSLFAEEEMRAHLDAGGPTALREDVLREILALPHLQRFAEFERLHADNFHVGPTVANLFNEGNPCPLPRDLAPGFVRLPFEEASVPVPTKYEEILSRRYGDWKQPVRWPVHAAICSANIPFRDYQEQVDRDWQVLCDQGVQKYSALEAM